MTAAVGYWVVLVSAVFVAACDSKETAQAGTGASTSQTVGPQGGTLSLEGMTLTIPAGALAESQLLTITSTKVPPPTDSSYGPLYQFAPRGTATTVLSMTGISAFHIAADSTTIYFVSNGDGAQAQLMSVPSTGGAAQTLANCDKDSAVAVDGASVFFSDAGSLCSVPKGGGNRQSIGIGSASDLVLDDANIYFTGAVLGDEGVFFAPKLGSGATKLVHSAHANSIAVDGANVYWNNWNEVLTVPKAGGSARTLAFGYGFPESVSIDGAGVVYFLTLLYEVFKLNPAWGRRPIQVLRRDSEAGWFDGNRRLLDPAEHRGPVPSQLRDDNRWWWLDPALRCVCCPTRCDHPQAIPLHLQEPVVSLPDYGTSVGLVGGQAANWQL
jgi:hypothetical protein